MKKIIAYLLAVCLLTLSVVPAVAIVPYNFNSGTTMVQPNNYSGVETDQAEMLKSLGLFLGTNNGFELDKILTRAETAALIVRFMGEEAAALEQQNPHPFLDVPDWANPYVGWLYANGITKGYNDTRYGSADQVTYWQFATMLSRAKDGDDNFIASGVGTEYEQVGIDRENMTPNDGSDFTRAEAVALLTRFLTLWITPDLHTISVAQYILDKGCYTAEQFGAAASNVYMINYRDEDGYITASILNIEYQRSELDGFVGISVIPDRAYFYAVRAVDDTTEIYRFDCLTLEPTLIDTLDFTFDGGYLDHIAAIGGDHSFVEGTPTYFRYDGGTNYLRLRYWVGNYGEDGYYEGTYLLSEIEDKLNVITKIDYYASSDATRAGDGLYTIILDDTLYILSETEVVTREIVEGTVLHKTVGGLAIYTSADGDTFTITASTLDTGEVADTYIIDLTDPKINRDAPLLLYNELYGEAGYFEVHDGRLIRITDRPTLDVSGVRIGASGYPVILTHLPGEYHGSEIYQYEYSSYPIDPDTVFVETARLSNDIPHGIIVDSIEGLDSSVRFFSRQPLGMDKYNTYSYLASYYAQGIFVLSFTSDRMEMLEHDIKWYIDTEQQRLTDLGLYNP